MAQTAKHRGWQVDDRGLTSDGTFRPSPPPVVQSIRLSRPRFQPPALDDRALQTFFKGIYERDTHIRLIHDAARAALAADDPSFGHTLLFGDPASCKTVLLHGFKDFYDHGSPVERVQFVDAPTLTKAGLENWLIDLAGSGQAPDILVVEELEKQPVDHLLVLLSVMGSGYVAKQTAFGRDRHPCRTVVWGICNDEKVVRDWRHGALWSRFVNKLFCWSPDRELSLRILLDVVAAMPDGKAEWAHKALELGWDVLGSHDIRETRSFLAGGDRLLDGSYQRDKLGVFERERQYRAELAGRNGGAADPGLDERVRAALRLYGQAA